MTSKHSRTVASASAALVVALTAALTGSTAVAQAATGDPVTHEENDYVPEGGAWTEHYFPSSDGSSVELHADVLLPANLPEGRKVPVIMSAGPYFGHSGQEGPEGREHTGPSDRFTDLVEGGRLFDRGYAFVMVDVRGYGGSTGCPDFAGPGEQADIEAAIDWAASQPWSTGSVGMYGKSYDAITGLAANDLKQDALKAVVAQEPMWDLYRNIRSNGVPRSTMVNVPNTYNSIAALPQLPDDDAHYRENAGYEKTHPECAVQNLLGYQTADPDSQYWKDRDLAERAKGTDTPLLFTQGLLEWNTEPEAVQEYLDNHQGPERGWLGPWDHVRGNDRVEDGRLAMGREGWFEETMSFYDRYLKGIEPSVRYPAYSIQDSTGKWRAQDTWPGAARTSDVRLGGGSYVDDGGESGTRTGTSFFQWSQPAGKPVRVTATPRISFDAKGYGNVMTKLYDVAPDGTAVLFNEQVSTLKPGEVAFDLKSSDWTLAAGHSLAVEIGTIPPTAGDWLDTPSREKITVSDARLRLALDDPADDTPTAGERAPYLDTYLQGYTSKLTVGTPTFTLPGQ
ncbi:CocE/NonD family hydrolase [Amycolatopsis jiangsuensis]|uniref:Putative acyl esterase n=1 Tax=Amycolatopsis jiangsuensis TaxID=1181879 RepID=A0A840J4K0_9PSEU|nr:CocE/NonD family hydrolase [Amycolatopsis jiangsuensis]MBB4688342.1 putative acyl esterase [Amycolatopsis jiangsuensis]